MGTRFAVDDSYVRDFTAVAVRDGRVALVTRDADRDDVTLRLCADQTCGRIGRRVDIPGLAHPVRLSLRILPDGRPVVLAGGDLAICTDPVCTDIAITQVVPPQDGYITQPVLTIGRTGLPLIAARSGGIWLHRCTDRLCKAPTRQLVSPTDPGVVRLAVAEATDGSVYVANLSREAMTLFRCARSRCG